MTKTLTKTLTIDTNKKLIEIATKRNLSRLSLSELLNVSTHTVDKWYSSKGTTHYRTVKAGTLEQLKLTLYVCDTVPSMDIMLSSPLNFAPLIRAGLIS